MRFADEGSEDGGGGVADAWAAMQMDDSEGGDNGLIAAPRKVAATTIGYAMTSKQVTFAFAASLGDGRTS